MIVKELLAAKRDGRALAPEEIAGLIGGIVSGSVSDAQIAAFAMAVCCKGLTSAETASLTRAMAESGERLDWHGELGRRPVIDKHSTGGVGDKTSLILAPLLAAAGAAVPMIAGRGLGHTGGTLDKLDAIPGYDSRPAIERFRRVVREVGCAIVGQTDTLAPADRRLYAIRDTTGTIESIPLITASILSKKLAAGLGGLVLDVKYGSGAFMRAFDDSEALARSLVDTAALAGLKAVALLTDMNEVLGRTAGNAIEIAEVVAYLAGRGAERRLDAVTRRLAAEMLLLAGITENDAEAERRIDSLLSSGKAAERFGEMVAALGGPSDLLDHPERYLAPAPVVRAVPASAQGYVGAVDARAIGLVILELGGGRYRAEDAIDPAVGLSDMAAIGSAVGAGLPLALVHARSEADAERAAARLAAAVRVDPEPPPARPLFGARLAV